MLYTKKDFRLTGSFIYVFNKYSRDIYCAPDEVLSSVVSIGNRQTTSSRKIFVLVGELTVQN